MKVVTSLKTHGSLISTQWAYKLLLSDIQFGNLLSPRFSGQKPITPRYRPLNLSDLSLHYMPNTMLHIVIVNMGCCHITIEL